MTQKKRRATSPPSSLLNAIAELPDQADAGKTPVIGDSISWRGWACLIAGWILPQLILIGPALVGRQILLPYDLLSVPRIYLPVNEETKPVHAINFALSDLIFVDKPARDFCQKEFRARRLPVWQSQNFLGSPFTSWPKYSPFEIPYWLFPHQQTLAWSRLLQALCLATGGWYFLKRAIGLSFWPAAIGSWCLPLIGFITVWQGYPITGSIVWLGWMLVAVDSTIRRPGRCAPLGLVAVTALSILSGQPDIGGLLLIAAGFYAVSRLFVGIRSGWPHLLKAVIALSFGWVLGILIASPYWLPLLSYARTGIRLQERLKGVEERPPVGVSALVNALSPEAFGNTRYGSVNMNPSGNLIESSAGAFAGMMAVLWLAPLAFCNRSRRSQAITWTAIAVFGISWQIGLPGFVQLLRLPMLNSFSFSRAVFMTSVAIVILASIGLEEILSGELRFRPWFLAPIILCVVCALGFLAVSVYLPEWVRVNVPAMIKRGQIRLIVPIASIETIQRSFVSCYVQSGVLAIMALIGWIWVSLGARYARLVLPAIVAVMAFELIGMASTESRLRDWQPDYPRVPALQKLSELPVGRIWGITCLPPNLNRFVGLSDVRGYDAVDPDSVVQLLLRVSDPQFPSPNYAKTQFLVPNLWREGDRFRLDPMIDLLNVRYFIARNSVPLPFPLILQLDDYWIYENTQALSRSYVPRHVQKTPASDVLNLLARHDFEPRQIAYVSEELKLPDECLGEVTLTDHSPVEIELNADMKTDGLVVLSDMWDSDWHATIDGQPTSIVKVDSALRGVVAPAGQHTIRMVYRPAAVQKGFSFAAFALMISLIWLVATKLLRRPSPNSIEK